MRGGGVVRVDEAVLVLIVLMRTACSAAALRQAEAGLTLSRCSREC